MKKVIMSTFFLLVLMKKIVAIRITKFLKMPKKVCQAMNTFS